MEWLQLLVSAVGVGCTGAIAAYLLKWYVEQNSKKIELMDKKLSEVSNNQVDHSITLRNIKESQDKAALKREKVFDAVTKVSDGQKDLALQVEHQFAKTVSHIRETEKRLLTHEDALRKLLVRVPGKPKQQP